MSISFNGYFNINTSLIEQVKIIASHMHETGEAEDALVWLLDELDKFCFNNLPYRFLKVHNHYSIHLKEID